MNDREKIIHRVRDFDAAIRLNKKTKTFIFVILRQLFKLLNVDEKKIKFLIENNISYLNGYKFFSRKGTLDFLFFSKFYEPETTMFVKNKRGDIFIDIGAHLGRFSILLSNNFDKILAFEPHPENYEILKKNIKLNHIKNVEILKLGLSDRKYIGYISNIKMNTGAVKIIKNGKIKIKITTLDDIIKEKVIDIKKVKLIKIDVEGNELSVLKGAKTLLRNGNFDIVVESFNVKKVKNFLSKYGFKIRKKLDFYNYVFSK